VEQGSIVVLPIVFLFEQKKIDCYTRGVCPPQVPTSLSSHLSTKQVLKSLKLDRDLAANLR